MAEPQPRGFSPFLLVTGLGALLVSAWALAGGGDIGDVVDLRWLFVAAALAVGLLLVLTPGRSRGRR